ncbi:Ribokinase-like protein [Radiomyces spectabilis]|uniref:Ribokinase-like protein n=1 Tax=Radiomyces spectabilis TaxID=64574 RepID=UPI00221F8617|nr:Ribokinase-like protein [Radiomyces spectabilis]KAI8391079.1 Ribokinase-like protein [Radiomyces spectabilis]
MVRLDGTMGSALVDAMLDQPQKRARVLLVGQIYLDTILTVDHFPDEDSKLRASRMEQRRGGNCMNAAEVLSQSHSIDTWCMSAIGSKETTSSLVEQLAAKGINTSTCLHRDTVTPSSYILHSLETGSRTIISCTSINDITENEFAQALDDVSKVQSRQPIFDWVHFEGRNIVQVVKQIDWLETKATNEGWRDRLTISVELEKPDREHIDQLMPKGDVVFFSKLFAERRGYEDGIQFLNDMRSHCKPHARLFCAWGAQGAVGLDDNDTGHRVPAPKIDRIIDPVGAGDTFIAGMIFALHQGREISSAMQVACKLASCKVSQAGFEGLIQAVQQIP